MRDTVRVVLRGELDLSTAPQVEQALQRLLAGGSTSIVVDLEDLRFADCAGLRAIRRAAARARALGGGLRIAGSSEPIRRVLLVTGLGGLLADQADRRGGV